MPPNAPAGPAPAGLSVGAAARRLGVSASTLRSWERRYGIAPSMRTTGGHRRYSADDLAALQHIRRLTAAGMATGSAARATNSAPPRPRGAGKVSRGAPAAARFAVAMEALDPRLVARTAEASLARLGPAQAWTGVFAPALRAIGERWACSGDGVEREHVATDAIQQALARYARRRTPGGASPRLLAAAAPGEQHVLPLHALAAALADSGVASCVLSALPARALHAAVTDLAPAMVFVWAQVSPTADTELLRGLLSRAPAVCAAGPGWERQPLPPEVASPPDLDTAVASVLAWVR